MFIDKSRDIIKSKPSGGLLRIFPPKKIWQYFSLILFALVMKERNQDNPSLPMVWEEIEQSTKKTSCHMVEDMVRILSQKVSCQPISNYIRSQVQRKSSIL
mmetsp:Transcript_38044/g.77630  ORF Transcript_38044/g.77630 Transcript_38044/m.77630 type:complete len:101 (-) Transcript_38044:42-344(-)